MAAGGSFKNFVPQPPATDKKSGNEVQSIRFSNILLNAFANISTYYDNETSDFQKYAILCGHIEEKPACNSAVITHLCFPDQTSECFSVGTQNGLRHAEKLIERNFLQSFGIITIHPLRGKKLSLGNFDINLLAHFQETFPHAIALVVDPNYNEQATYATYTLTSSGLKSVLHSKVESLMFLHNRPSSLTIKDSSLAVKDDSNIFKEALHSSTKTRRRMDSDNDGNSGPSGEEGVAAGASVSDGEQESDIMTLLRYLVRSGNVSIIQGGEEDGEEDSDEEDNGLFDDYTPRLADTPKTCSNPKDAEKLKATELSDMVLMDSGQMNNNKKRKAENNESKTTNVCKTSVSKMLQLREVGMRTCHKFSQGDQRYVASAYLPNTMEVMQHYGHKAFCGVHSKSGDIFLSACQDRSLRVFNTSNGQFRRFKRVQARDVGWSVLDTAFSPDGNYMIYSSWSEYIHLVSIYGDLETHTALPLCPELDHSFCIFSVTFSDDNTEIMGGANDGHIYVYDREKNERTLRIDAHDDDVNTVRFADSSSNILTSGADDGLIKVWDRRTLREEAPAPVGVLAGHTDGATYIDNKGDGRYLISNSKDQTIKLWDLRKFSDENTQQATKRAVAGQSWDYRWQRPRSQRRLKKIQGDSSLMTYRYEKLWRLFSHDPQVGNILMSPLLWPTCGESCRIYSRVAKSGHSVLHTLVRCRFSPEFSTGQRYIYTGCATGALVIYDVLTGEIISRLHEHNACVRDVSWHPYENNIITTSWDGRVGMWTYSDQTMFDDEECEHNSGGSDDDDPDSGKKTQPRRSTRLKNRTGILGNLFNTKRRIIMD